MPKCGECHDSPHEVVRGYRRAEFLFHHAFGMGGNVMQSDRSLENEDRFVGQVRDWRGAELPRPFPAPPHKNCS